MTTPHDMKTAEFYESMARELDVEAHLLEQRKERYKGKAKRVRTMKETAKSYRKMAKRQRSLGFTRPSEYQIQNM